MDTKWKSRLHFVLALLFVTLGLTGVMSGLSRGNEYIGQNFFDTEQFKSENSKYLEQLNLFELGITPKNMKEKITVTEEEIEEYRFRYGDLPEQIDSIKTQYEGQISEAEAVKNKELIEMYEAERDKKINDIMANFQSDKVVEEKISKVKEKEVDAYFQEMTKNRKEFLEFDKAYTYYLEDMTTGEVYTNLNLDSEDDVSQYINKKDMLYLRSIPMDEDERSYFSSYSDYTDTEVDTAGIIESFADRELKGQVGISKDAPKSSPIMKEYKTYKTTQKLAYSYLIASLLALLLGAFMIRKSGVWKTIEISRSTPVFYSKIPIDVRAGVLLVTILILGDYITDNMYQISYSSFYYFVREFIHQTFWTVLFLVLTLIQGSWFINTLKNKENIEEEWKESLIYKAKDVFLVRRTGVQMVILLGITFATGIGISVVFMENEAVIVFIPLFLFVTVPAVIYLLIQIGKFNRIVRYTDELVNGHYASDLPAKGNSTLSKLARNINSLKTGVKTSQQEQAKSERLKTELITNVSHDLRTPLTSIITYTELLKNPNLSEEERTGYLQIIDRKSKRLKVLIDDLFEASKMASGSIELVKDRADIVQLLQQSLAERDEAIKQSSLQFRVSMPDKCVAFVDGQKLWRVFDNLIGNILNYSLENTRVYISVTAERDRVVITFKNVTKYELGDNTDEMFERFKRGDTSRHTEGSGLGLAIAKSIVDLHGGTLDIDVDGDLFKAVVMLDLN
ncbi:GHKL domain-containing protein [Peribacillus psychrosaccharolyticus]|uniref:histidine kinase n=1 Tax=Peribacillus psychrosaccharolyticus TaxID=1407 RepID=A0A974RYZ6_PERPY|nr:histidine kinase dimerization/phospho-acceptor domain-containing protein [Peribacillus psychrosaccharolyticus]MEC2055219.1 histidine kinase dimerization/phospho-acceptor domain-containing protein [Peribacillus psychrosaccharolyticus]MED3745209.1 histidine kinase dimerization/phospho-acceptor domain-containing protein [Peribacillus psychrosaccharolyticus]QQS98928.1 GHKL domain-containing protein [Peribacillus psychrosaccharolyticus]